ncbi:hypothetical protein [Croceitalea rosinachiae]|uniref:Uncharacterized protein n=1 Tax=Croceitalea rosinachiae TaxID=3075596 RepID=A0ABU3AF14_9FLAO|nr:hypothetical protein [Croceitalea sp. F388]MDT0607678.1 hypothetical protein [Croceitalea sp. F388]
MKRFLKITSLVLGLGILFFLLFAWVKSEPLPEGNKGPEADALAQKMLATINMERYKNTRFLEWTFRSGANHFFWDKVLGICKVKWDGYEVALI